MTSYNGQTITYDAIGNPINYINGMHFTWERGRKLAYVDLPSQQRIAYYYDANGQRIYKSAGNATTSYYWQDGILLGQKTGDDILRFLYDETGRAYGFLYNETAYYYIFNLQGDVIYIITGGGDPLVSYTYDAFGKILSISGDTTIANLNPIRYRGYYYDAETGFYYLNSRYYDPEIGRFINADAAIGVNQDITTYNLFVYCGNNPIVRADNEGYFWDTVFDVVSLVFSVADVIQDPSDPWAWAGLAADVMSLAVPFATGGGAIVKTATKADDVVDAFKAADNLGEVGEVIVKYGDEVKLPNQIKVNDAVDAWDDFLGPNQTSYNKFTGTNEMDRIFSADGTRSIRFGGHEMRSIGTTKAHFHYENWLFDPTSNTVYVENILQRVK